MKIIFYGTGGGAGVPELFCSCRVCEYARRHGGRDIRTRSQATVDNLMIDCSIDAVAHTVFYGLDMRKYRNVLITHTHSDHYSAPDMISRYIDADDWTFYLPAPAAQNEIERTARAVAASTSLPVRRAPRIREAVPFVPIQIEDAVVTPLPSNHARAIGSVLYLIESGGKTLLWVHDSGLMLPETVEYLRQRKPQLDAVSLDCNLKRGENITPAHMDILQCAQTAQLLCDLGCATHDTRFILNHIGHLLDRTHEELCEEAKEFGFEVAYDQMVWEI